MTEGLTLPPIQQRQGGGSLPLAYQQGEWWRSEQAGVVGWARSDGRGSYTNIHTVLHVHGAIDAPLVQRSLDELARRHESLRTRYIVRDEKPLARIQSPTTVALEEVDLTTIQEGARDAEGHRLISDAIMRPFAYADDQLVRACLVQRAADEHLLAIVVPHLVADGLSVQRMAEEVVSIYERERTARDPLPAPSVQYGDFVMWQREWLSGSCRRAIQQDYRQRLAGACAPLLPHAADVGERSDYGAGQVAFDIGATSCQQLVTHCGLARATPFMALLGAFVMFLGRWSGVDDVLVMSPFAARGLPETTSLVGFVATCCPIRIDVSGDPAFRETIRRTREAVLTAQAFQHVPYSFMQELAAEDGERLPRPCVGINISLGNQSGSRNPRGAGATAEGARHWHRYAIAFDPLRRQPLTRWHLNFCARPSGNGSLLGSLGYRAAIFDRSLVERAAQDFAAVLDVVAREPATKLSQLELPRLTARQVALAHGRRGGDAS